MECLLAIFAIIYGIVGWFAGLLINQIATSLPHGTTIWQQPQCASCHTPFSGYHSWSAIISRYQNQRGCSNCGQPKKYLTRSIVVEIITPLLFIFLWYSYNLSLLLFIISVHTILLLLITVTDLEHRYIYNAVMLPALIFSLVTAVMIPSSGFWEFGKQCRSVFYWFFELFVFIPQSFWVSAILGGAFAFVVSYIAYLLGNLVYGHGALGAGDVTLSVYLGLIMGMPYIFLALIMAVFLGAIIPVILILFRQVSRQSYIPYGPFLTISGWVMLIWGDQIWRYFYC